MRRLALILIGLMAFSSLVRAQDPRGWAEPDGNYSPRTTEGDNAGAAIYPNLTLGLALHDTITSKNVIMGLDRANMDSGVPGGCHFSPSYPYCFPQPVFMDHPGVGATNYVSSGCTPAEQGPKTSDVCAFGRSDEDMWIETSVPALDQPNPQYGSMVTDTQLIEMDPWPNFVPDDTSRLIPLPKSMQPQNRPGPWQLSSELNSTIPLYTEFVYWNRSLGGVDTATMTSTLTNTTVYMGPSEIGCDQYNDCEFNPPSAYTSNYGAPHQNTPFWTHPGASGGLDTNTFILNNSVNQSGNYVVTLTHPTIASNIGAVMYGDTVCEVAAGRIWSAEYASNGTATLVGMDNMYNTIQLGLNFTCGGMSTTSCSGPKTHNWQILGATCSSTVLRPMAALDPEVDALSTTKQLESLDPAEIKNTSDDRNDLTSFEVDGHNVIHVKTYSVECGGHVADGNQQQRVKQMFKDAGITAPVLFEKGAMWSTTPMSHVHPMWCKQ